MKPTYSIRDWSRYFENNRTRDLKDLRFVILPNKQDGDGYTELLDHPNGAAHYGAWVGIVQVASKGKHPPEECDNPAGCCECRGSLLRSNARPHDPASLSRLTRIPASVFEEALPRLVNIGWLELLTQKRQQNQTSRTIPHDDGTIPQGGAALARARVQNRTEQNGKEDDDDWRSKYSKVQWQSYIAEHPGIKLRPRFLKSAGTGKHDETMKDWLEQNNGINATNRPGKNQTAAERRAAEFGRKLEKVKQLQRESSGAVDETVRGKPDKTG